MQLINCPFPISDVAPERAEALADQESSWATLEAMGKLARNPKLAKKPEELEKLLEPLDRLAATLVRTVRQEEAPTGSATWQNAQSPGVTRHIRSHHQYA